MSSTCKATRQMLNIDRIKSTPGNNFFHSCLDNKSLWGCLVGLILVFTTSGHVWNTIRHARQHGAKEGSVRDYFIHPRIKQQYAYESDVMALLMTATAMSFLFLGVDMHLFRNIRLRQALCLAAVLNLFLCFGTVLSIYGVKNHKYPFCFRIF